MEEFLCVYVCLCVRAGVEQQGGPSLGEREKKIVSLKPFFPVIQFYRFLIWV